MLRPRLIEPWIQIRNINVFYNVNRTEEGQKQLKNESTVLNYYSSQILDIRTILNYAKESLKNILSLKTRRELN